MDSSEHFRIGLEIEAIFVHSQYPDPQNEFNRHKWFALIGGDLASYYNNQSQHDSSISPMRVNPRITGEWTGWIKSDYSKWEIKHDDTLRPAWHEVEERYDPTMPPLSWNYSNECKFCSGRDRTLV